MARVRAFCVMLGWAVWLAASGATMAWTQAAGPPRPGWAGAFVFAAVLLGWAAYRLTLWWMTPPTRPALPTGGFEVLPAGPSR